MTEYSLIFDIFKGTLARNFTSYFFGPIIKIWTISKLCVIYFFQLLPSSIDDLMFTTRHAQMLCDWFVPTSNFN